jgi:beta-N-acetylhexosaminidase
MTRKTRRLISMGAALLWSFSCAARQKPVLKPVLSAVDSGWVEKMLRRMTVEEKAGQLIGCRFVGEFRNLDSAEIRGLLDLIERSKIGAVCLFGGEVYETAHLTNLLQSRAEAPLLVASDFERGAGTQITNATLFPPLMAIGASGSEELAYRMGKITALEGRAMGVHQTYAPVVDVNVNPDNPIINVRSIGETPELVARLARAFIRGCQDNGMIATAKHFPGHGDTAEDSHIGLPTISGDRARLDRVELFPFREAVAAGVGAIMSSHLFVPALDPTPGLPATLSPAVMTGLLRGEMGFKGLLVTDAMEMGGITNAFSPEEAALRAVRAGIDQVLLPLEPAKVVAHLAGAARDGRLPMKRLDEAVRRILEAKSRLGLHRRRFVRIESLGTVVAPKDNRDWATRAFEAAATLARNEGGVLPLAPGQAITVLSLSSDPGDYFAGQAFALAMKRRHPAAAIFYADGDTGQETLDAAAIQAEGEATKAVVVALFSRLGAWKGNVDLAPKHVALVQRLAAGAAPVIVVSFGSPYFLRCIPDVDAYLCLYRNTPETQQIAARALCGEMDVAGRLPVSLPGLYPFGHGLDLRRIR